MYGKGDRQLGGNNPYARNVICIETGQVFPTVKEGSEWCDRNRSTLTRNCKGMSSYCGEHPITGEKLHWMYYDEYLKLKKEENDNNEEL